MRFWKYLAVTAAAAAALCMAPKSQAQISVGVQLGAAPVCPYGYYGYAPYHCAPYGFYGPEWYSNGVFIGAGPWHRGGDFHGHVDYHYDEHHGYHGPYPGANEHYHPYGAGQFHGNEMH